MNVQTIATRSSWFTLNGVLWALQIVWGFFFAGSGFGKVLLYDGALYAADVVRTILTGIAPVP